MRTGPRKIALGVVALLAFAGCSDAEQLESAGDGGTTTTTPNTYNNEVDGVSAAWPEGWHRSEEPLGGTRASGLELLALATFDGARAGQCSPHPDAAMTAMEEDDALFVLRTTESYQDVSMKERPPRPTELMAAAQPHPDAARAGQPAVEGSCFPPGVDAWLLSFQEHGRHYEAFVAARAPLSDQRRRELQEIWSGLQIRPIETGLEEAKVGRPYWHLLYTHCGIKGTKFDGRDWVADPELSDGQGNPPPGWDPYGTITLTEENVAVFETRDGENTAKFRPRTPADGDALICQ